MHEIVVNLHMHTRYSDGGGSHKDIAKFAMQENLDVVIVTDHNVLVQGVEGYYRSGSKRVLLLVGQEVHDQSRDPQKNHMLIFNANRDVATFGDDPQHLIDATREAEGMSFIAHPSDPAAPAFDQTDISWEAWDVNGFTGIELWNGLSEFKTYIKSKLHGIFYAYFPKFIGHGPLPEVIKKWDELLKDGKRIIAIGGSDAHAWPYSMGPITRVIFPYKFHFKTVNTHIFTTEALSGETASDRNLIYEAIQNGRCFVGYDLPASTKSFRFSAQGRDKTAIMGEEIPAKGGVTLQIHLPEKTECRLIKDGEVIQVYKHRQNCTHITTEPGVYRVEVYRWYLGRKVGWIFSNPIYLR